MGGGAGSDTGRGAGAEAGGGVGVGAATGTSTGSGDAETGALAVDSVADAGGGISSAVGRTLRAQPRVSSRTASAMALKRIEVT